MMRRLALTATVLFWLGVAGFGLWHMWRSGEAGVVGAGAATVLIPAADVPATSTPAASVPAASTPAASVPVAAEPVARRITLAELVRHDRGNDCWLAIDGVVYDVSAYTERHPTEPAVLNVWCGREASEAYRTKGLPGGSRPHSARADAMLPRYRIGTLAPAN